MRQQIIINDNSVEADSANGVAADIVDGKDSSWHNLQQRLQHRYHHIHVYICKYCVCPRGPYVLLDFEIKLNISIINNYMYITYGRKKQ